MRGCDPPESFILHREIVLTMKTSIALHAYHRLTSRVLRDEEQSSHLQVCDDVGVFSNPRTSGRLCILFLFRRYPLQMTLIMKLSVLKFVLGYIHFLTSPKVQPFADVCNHRFTMASADFSPFAVTTASYSVSTADEISLGTTRFFPSTYLPHLLCIVPYSYRALTCIAALPLCTA